MGGSKIYCVVCMMSACHAVGGERTLFSHTEAGGEVEISWGHIHDDLILASKDC